VSASLQVSEILASNEAVEIVQLGGVLRHSSNSVVGKYAEQMLSNFCCSKLFLGVDGIDLEFGLTTTDVREAELNREMMRTAQKIVVLADSSKFRRRGFSKIANIEDVDIIITDSGIPEAIARRIEELGVELIVVEV
jgi:DeoR/GlpR family transcriptional regulator of sugar metabolism